LRTRQPNVPVEHVSPYALMTGAAGAKIDKSATLPENQTTKRAGDKRSQAPPLVRRAWRINDACAALGIGRTTLYKLAGEGKIKLVRVLGRTLVPESEIERIASEGT
jgi:excisionase family DNA binding protein